MTLLFDLLYALAALIGWPLLVVRRIRRGRGSIALRDRLGNVPSRPVAAHCVWIHGVSLGEINATRSIVREIHRLDPNAVVVVSSTTQTGLAQARQLYPKLVTFRFPLDFSFVLRRVFERIRPSAIVLMELEVWPNLIEMAHARGVPVVIANGRITHERSVRRFTSPLLRPFARRMFSRLAFVGAQDEANAERFRAVGAPHERIVVTGSLKYDTAEIADAVAGQDELADSLTIDRSRPLLVCGSTGDGEEAILLDAYESLRSRWPALQLALIPRRPERFDEVAALIASRGFACLRRSGKPPIVPPGVETPTAVFLGDTMGELRRFYGLASATFVGRSLVAMGGSDVMEAAALGKPVLVGPHVDNFAEACELLREAGALHVVRDAASLADAVEALLRDAARRSAMGRAGQALVASKVGATERTVRRILELIVAPR